MIQIGFQGLEQLALAPGIVLGQTADLLKVRICFQCTWRQVVQPVQQSQVGEGQYALLVAKRGADLDRLAGLAETVTQTCTGRR